MGKLSVGESVARPLLPRSALDLRIEAMLLRFLMLVLFPLLKIGRRLEIPGL